MGGMVEVGIGDGTKHYILHTYFSQIPVWSKTGKNEEKNGCAITFLLAQRGDMYSTFFCNFSPVITKK